MTKIVFKEGESQDLKTWEELERGCIIKNHRIPTCPKHGDGQPYLNFATVSYCMTCIAEKLKLEPMEQPTVKFGYYDANLTLFHDHEQH